MTEALSQCNELMTKAEVADRLRVTKRTIDRLVFNRKLAKVKLGNTVRFDSKDVEKMITNSKCFDGTSDYGGEDKAPGLKLTE